MLTLAITIIVSMSVSFITSLFEACLLSLSLSDIAKLQEKHPLVARTWTGFKRNIDKPMAVILIVNTLSNAIGALLSGTQVENLIGPEYIVIFSIVYSFVLIQWTEILPKTLGVKYNKRLARISAIPLKVLINIFAPFVMLVHFVNRIFSGKIKTDEKLDVVGEIAALAHFAHSTEAISKDQERILARALSLSKTKVMDVMVRLDEIKYLTTDMSLAEALIAAHLHHHTRFPLVDKSNPESISRYVNFKDIVTALRINPADPTLQGISRPIQYLHGEEMLSQALSHMTSGYQHIAIVSDSNGKPIGLVTLENIIESFIGDLKDEYDILPSHFYRLSDTRVLAGGGMKVLELFRQIGLPEISEDISVNDWLFHEFGRVPDPEERIVHHGFEFSARKISRSKIYEAVVDKIGPEQSSRDTLSYINY